MPGNAKYLDTILANVDTIPKFTVTTNPANFGQWLSNGKDSINIAPAYLGGGCHGGMLYASKPQAMYNWIWGDWHQTWVDYIMDPDVSPYRKFLDQAVLYRPKDAEENGICMIITDTDHNCQYITHLFKAGRYYSEKPNRPVGQVINALLDAGVHPGVAIYAGRCFRMAGDHSDKVYHFASGHHGSTYKSSSGLTVEGMLAFINGTWCEPDLGKPMRANDRSHSYTGVDQLDNHDPKAKTRTPLIQHLIKTYDGMRMDNESKQRQRVFVRRNAQPVANECIHSLKKLTAALLAEQERLKIPEFAIDR